MIVSRLFVVVTHYEIDANVILLADQFSRRYKKLRKNPVTRNKK